MKLDNTNKKYKDYTINLRYYKNKKLIDKPKKAVSYRKKIPKKSRRMHENTRYVKYMIPPKMLNLFLRGGWNALMNHTMDSGFMYGHSMHCLQNLWLGYKIAKSQDDMEEMKRYAKAIQTVAVDELGLLKPSFPNLGPEFLGEHYFMYEKPARNSSYHVNMVLGVSEVDEFAENVVTTDTIPHRIEEEIDDDRIEEEGFGDIADEQDKRNEQPKNTEERELVVLFDNEADLEQYSNFIDSFEPEPEKEAPTVDYFMSKLNQKR